MPRSDSADSQSQAIQEEPLPSTSNEEEDPLAGTFKAPHLNLFVFFLFENSSNVTNHLPIKGRKHLD